MATLAESLVSSTSRAVKLRMRPDLTARKHRYHGQTYWVVKEPIGLHYFRFHEEEFAILNMLDGRTSFDDIKQQFEEEFTPQKITFGDLQHFVGMLHRNGLVISEAGGQGKQLRIRRDQKKWRELMGKVANVFALRFRGVDPERFLTWLYRYTGWFFRWYTVIAVLMFGLTALLLVGSQYDTFMARLPTFHQFFGPKNWIYLGITMGVVKIFHEFGHGLSCKHFGGECHELGAMLLVFTPALYCNVSDSWMLPNKWHRAAIGAAGMYVELFIASCATYVWWFSQPGLLNQLALSVMFICSVSTVVFNGNPLLRFDGYYILMDLAEIPNLRQKSTEILRRAFQTYCLGMELPDSPFLPQRNRIFFALYTIAAELYRLMVVFSILFFLNQVFEPYGLKIIGQLIGFAGVFGLFFQPLYQLFQFFYMPGGMRKVKKHRVYVTIAVAAALIAAIILVPLPFAVHCSFEVVPRNAENLYAAVPGILAEPPLVKPRDTVTKGTVIAVLKNVDLELELKELESRLKEAEAKLDGTQILRSRDSNYAGQFASAEAVRDAALAVYQEKQREFDMLKIVAETDGMVFAPPFKPDRKGPEGMLPVWSGSPFDQKNIGAKMDRSDMICRIGDPSELEAMLVIDQAYDDLVNVDHKVRLLLEAYTDHAYDGIITYKARTELKQPPANLTTQAGGTLDTKVDKTGNPQTISTSYQARVPLKDSEGMFYVGLRGHARIYTGYQSLGQRLYRYVIRTFHFHL